MYISKHTITAVLILALAACDTSQEKIMQYAAEKKLLMCQMEKLNLQNDSLWNEMAIYLDHELPPEISPAERENMVNIKNAKLISMHKVFPTLDTSIQNKVMAAGKADERIAGEMKIVMKNMDDVEQKMNHALEGIENRNIEEFKQLKLQTQEYQQRPCN